MLRYTFSKTERLNNKKKINLLFEQASSVKTSYFTVLYLLTDNTKSPDNSPVQVLISVPKRLCRLSVHRNLVKRRIRESYRLQKHTVIQSIPNTNKQLLLAFIYQTSEILDFKTIDTSIREALTQINEEIIKSTQTNSSK